MAEAQAAARSPVSDLQHRASEEAHVAGAASLQERRFLTLKYGESFGVFDQHGDALAGPDNPEGLFHRDTRHLSHFLLLIEKRRPVLLSSLVRHDNAALICDLTNPDLDDAQGCRVLEKDMIHIRRTRFLWKQRALERIAVHNYDREPRTVRLEFEIAADFADLFEVRGQKRPRCGQRHRSEVHADGVTLAYTGLDEVRRETRLFFEPKPDAITPERIAFDLSLGADRRKTLFVEVRCNGGSEPAEPRRAFFSDYREARRTRRRSVSRAASVASSNEVFNEVVRRAVSDLYTLVTNTEHGPYPYAGIPWYSTVFGRDALITAQQTLWLDPAIAKGVLTHLAALQAVEENAEADAAPGQILHEVRNGEMAALGEVPFGRYFGSIDSTPLFVMLAGSYLERTGDVGTLRKLWPNIEAALSWMLDYGDRDGDGFIEYGRQSEKGLTNQGWKDSGDSISYQNGDLAQAPLAVVEVQAYAYGAWRAAATVAKRLRLEGEGKQYALRADALQRAFDSAFFDEELGTYVLALDRDKRPCRVRTSNAGYPLFTGLALPERAESVVRDLMQPSMFSGWGIRTLASTEERYNPMSYHNGSVWPHDTAMVASGMARYGFRAEAARLFHALYDASSYIDLRRLPELFCGFAKMRGHGPTFYPVACSPQAWAAGSVLSLLQTCLGLNFDPEEGYVTFEEPVLPDFLPSLTLRHLSMPGGSLDVELNRVGSEVAAHVLARRGLARVLVRA